MSLFVEFKRRNVHRVGAAYVVTSWLLVQVAETIFPLFGFDETPARIVVIVLAIGLIPALVFAWAFELTPEGLKKESEVDRVQSITPQTGKKLDRMIMVVLALALGYFAFDKFVLSESREATIVEQARRQGRSEALVESYGDKSIAVLAFRDMSPGQDQAYLSEGIAEELLNLLAGIPELRVISRSSAFSFKDQNLEIPEIARRLDVAHILEGSVRQAGDRVRITAQLIDARTDTQLWSETYDRTLDDIFAIQDEISGNVVQQLKLQLLGTPQAAQEIDPEAYSLYLQARFLSNQVSSDSIVEARNLFEQALALEPDYAPAWNGLSVNYFRMSTLGLIPREESRLGARHASDRAIELDPNYAPAYAHAAWLSIFQDNDLVAAARELQRALDLQPSDPWIIGRAAALLFLSGRIEEAIELGDYEIARDPLYLPAYYNQGLRFLAARRWTDAIDAYRTVLRLNPSVAGAHFGISEALLQKGESAAALRELEQEGHRAYKLIGLALVYHARNEQDQADQALADLEGDYADDFASGIGRALAYRREVDAAFEWLGRAALNRDSALPEDIFSALLDPLREDSRWLPFLESIGKSPAQLAAIDFKVTLPE
jgi:TolB-like protein/lipoprotein NlpI